jgi:hypothetical protein
MIEQRLSQPFSVDLGLDFAAPVNGKKGKG